MKRREFITLLVGAAAAWPLVARAQQPNVPVIGSLCGVSEAQWANLMAAFRSSLADMGFVERRNVAIEYRWADGQFDRLPALADDLVRRKVAVIFATGSDLAVQAAMSATKTIPIVFQTASDPIEAGFVSSIGRPEGNVTGGTRLSIELAGKRLELLHELVPGASKIALLVNPNNPRLTQDVTRRSEAAARQLGLEIVLLEAGTVGEIETAIEVAVQQRVGALVIGNEAFLGSRARQIAFLGLRHALPTIGGSRGDVEAGVLMSYGSDPLDTFRLVGVYVSRILKGEKPADLPVMQPTKFELFFNQTTAKTIGLQIPAKLLALADDVIE